MALYTPLHSRKAQRKLISETFPHSTIMPTKILYITIIENSEVGMDIRTHVYSGVYQGFFVYYIKYVHYIHCIYIKYII